MNTTEKTHQDNKYYTSDSRAIRVNYDLSAPPEKVWRALTEPELLEQWLFPNDIDPTVGQSFAFRTTPAPGFDGVIKCEVKEVERPHRLVYSWQSGPADTLVTWTLEPTDTGYTRLSLVHEGFRPEDDMIYEILEKGWRDRSAGLLHELIATV